MKFKKFTSIENSYRTKYIDILRMYDFENIEYIATEKIHGANFSFITDGKEIQVAGRNQTVDGTFYHCQSVIDDLSDEIIKLKNEIYSYADQITIFGELYGSGIQSGIYYGEKKRFRAFELQVDGDTISQADLRLVLDTYNIPQVPFVGIYDNLTDALNESEVFVSKVIDLDMLEDGEDPTIAVYELGENDAEGLVIQPLHGPYFTGNGARVMLKHKHKKFTEKNKRKARESKSRVENPFINIVEQYVNQNRLDAVMSKFVGEPTPKDFGKIIGLMSVDVIEDMIKDNDIPTDYRKQDEYKPVGKAVSSVVANFLKEHLLPKL